MVDLTAVESVYLAARYSRYDEMQGVRDVLGAAFGIKVTSRWIDLHAGALDTSIPPERLNAHPDECAPYALADVEDVLAADTVISFTNEGGGGKGGRHVEFGIGLGAGKHLIVVGPREHVFHTHADVLWFPDWSRLMMALTRARIVGGADR